MIPYGNLLPLMVIVPLFAAVAIVILNRLPRRVFDILSILTAAVLMLCSLLLVNGVAERQLVVYHIAGWLAPLGIPLVADGLSVFMLVLVNVLFLLLVIYSIEFMERFSGKWQYYSLFMFMLTGLNGVLVSGDLFNLFIFVEMTSVAAYFLAAFERRAESFESSFKYAILGSVSSLLALFALALVYSRTSSLSLASISVAWSSNHSPLGMLVVLLLIVGFGLKATLVPFHAWVPDAYSSAPAPVSAAYSGAVSKVLGVYLLARLFYNVFGITPAVLQLFAILGVLSILVGVTLALFQWDLKRLLAYHSISQLGYIVLGLGLGTPLGIAGALLHVVNHSAFKSLLFLNAGSVEYATGKRNLKELGGIAAKMPVTSSTSMIASLSISGIPPLNGFWSKLAIIIACVYAGRYWLALCAVIGSILTLSSFMKVQRYAFLGYVKDAFASIKESPLAMTLPMVILAVMCLFLGVLLLPGAHKNILDLAMDALLRGKDYASLLAAGGAQ